MSRCLNQKVRDTKQVIRGTGRTYYVLVATRKTIEKLGQSSFISVVTGFWYEYTLANPGAYGFDLNNQAVTLFGEGKAKVSTSTWPQVCVGN